MIASLDFLAPWLTSLRPGAPSVAGPITLVPLLGPNSVPPITTLGAHRDGEQIEVKEVSESGVVARVLVVNGALVPLLLLDGEELVGAKQNRLVNASILVGAGASLEIPVSCCERGRWRHVSRGFTSSGRSMPWSMKDAKHRRVSQSLKEHRGFDADQGATWRDVDSYLRERGVSSRSDALSAAFDADFESLRGLRRQLFSGGPEQGQIGLAFSLRGTLLGMELFGSPALYAQAHERLLHAFFAEALDIEPGPFPTAPEPLGLARSVLSAEPSTRDSPGLGDDHRFECAQGTGFLLSWQGAPIHAAVFAGPSGRVGRASDRDERSEPRSRRWDAGTVR